MNKTARILLCLAAGTLCLVSLAADSQSSQDDAPARTIHLKQDDGQVRFDSRVYATWVMVSPTRTSFEVLIPEMI